MVVEYPQLARVRCILVAFSLELFKFLLQPLDILLQGCELRISSLSAIVVSCDSQEEHLRDEVARSVCLGAVEFFRRLLVSVDLGFILDVNAWGASQVIDVDSVNLGEGSVHEGLA